MDNVKDLRLLLESRYPLVLVETHDEGRFLGIVRRLANRMTLPVWVWSVTEGLVRDGETGDAYGTTDPRKCLDFIETLPHPGIFVMADAHAWMKDPIVCRKVKEVAQGAKTGQTLVLTGPTRGVPPELVDLAVVWSLEPPAQGELEALVRRTVVGLAERGIPHELKDGDIEALAEAMQGLSMKAAERVIQRVALEDGKLDHADLVNVRQAKAELMEGDGSPLELVNADFGTLDAVGGMDELKRWLQLRARAFEPAATEFGIDPPRGMLLLGVPGCGKSLVAKTLARTWDLPLVLLDPARLYGPYIGESESKLRDALGTIDAMAPIVIWVDEIEKGFASGGVADSGTSRRILGSFLRWMQDRPAGAFLVATCNDVKELPPEFLRKGRFDEIFFVDLPEQQEREAIFGLQLSRRKRDPSGFDLRRLAESSGGFSGAEIEAGVVSALYRAFGGRHVLTTEDILAELVHATPLSRTRAEDITALRAWASGRATPASNARGGGA